MEKGFGHALSAEFKKIVWPKGRTAGKQILLIVVTAAILGVLVNYLDVLVKLLVGLLS